MNNYKWHLMKTNNGLIKPKSVIQGGSLYKRSVAVGGSITSLDQVNDDKLKVNVGGIQVKSGGAMTYNINPSAIPDALPTGKAGRRKKGGSFNF